MSNTKNTERKSNAKQDILHRVGVLYTLFIIAALVITARLIWVQFVSPSVKHNAEIMSDGVYRTKTIPAHRGAILSSTGEPLALSSVRYEATFDFAAEGFRDATPEDFKTNVDSLAKLLALHFSEADAEREGYDYISESEYRNIFYTNIEKDKKRAPRALKVFPRSVTTDEWNMMKNSFPILNQNMGVVYGSERVDERIYPSDDLARQVIGRDGMLVVRGDTVTGSGLELIYDEYLSGHDGLAVEQRIAHGFWTRVNDKRNRMPEDGCNVVTTIDAGLQKMATERLRDALTSEEASFGVAMVMEAATGNILCMVNLSSGTERGTNYSERVYNHAMSTALCPGSTIKLASAMALLEIGGMDIDSTVEIKGSAETVGKTRVVDSHNVAREVGSDSVTLRDGFAHSSNIFFAKAVYERFKDDPKRYTDFLEGLLFNDYVGLGEFKEARSVIPHPGTEEWRRHGDNATTLPRLAFGYVIELPTVHTLTFYNGVANGGRMVAPRLVDRIERDGEVVKTMPVLTLKDKMCSDKTLDALYECLAAAAVPERTAWRLKDLPISFGCKTGTAQIWGNFNTIAKKDYQQMLDGMTPSKDNYYLGSIVTMMPQENPKYTIMVSVAKQSTPTHPTYFGISLTGSVARDIMEYVYDNDPTLHATLEQAETPYGSTAIKSGLSTSVERIAKRLANESEINNDDSEWSVATVNETGCAVVEPRKIEEGVVPNVVGMGLSDALYLLEHAGLKVTHTGAGRVVSQSIKNGTRINANIKNIHLYLER